MSSPRAVADALILCGTRWQIYPLLSLKLSRAIPHKRWGIRGRIDHPFDRGLDNLVCGIKRPALSLVVFGAAMVEQRSPELRSEAAR